jgi:acetyl-CoA acyltransferase
MSANDAVIVSAVRSAVARGRKDGSLAKRSIPVDLSAEVLKAAVSRAGVAPGDVDDVIWGCAMPEASQGLNMARLSVSARDSPSRYRRPTSTASARRLQTSRWGAGHHERHGARP